MLEKTRGIVLRTIKYNETNNIVDIYTEAFGRMAFLVPVSRSRRATLRSGWMQPLSMLDLDITVKPTTRLQRIKELRCTYPLVSIPCHPHKTAIALFLAEMLARSLREEGENQALFVYLQHSIRWFDACEGRPFANFHLVFLMRLSRFLGIYPNLDNYRCGNYFDMLNACFVSLPPVGHQAYLSAAEAALIPAMMRMNYDTMHLFELNRVQRNRCLEIIVRYYQLHIPAFGEPKSLEILRELFV
ncbi:MAG: DNA repair protein RecO [Prevotellaceae bacterium]|jgi:DNA repair protein RecO (recombination protein O)|nr:DNA repair protein RecO [Prevotellaceae bacterium]